MFMLDTNIIIFSIRHPHSACAKKLASHVGKDVCISVITYAELEYGIENSSNPSRNREAIQFFLAGIPIVDFDLDASVHFGQILAALRKKHKDHQGHDREWMISASARSRGFTLITDNLKDFIDIDNLNIESWRESGDLELNS